MSGKAPSLSRLSLPVFPVSTSAPRSSRTLVTAIFDEKVSLVQDEEFEKESKSVQAQVTGFLLGADQLVQAGQTGHESRPGIVFGFGRFKMANHAAKCGCQFADLIIDGQAFPPPSYLVGVYRGIFVEIRCPDRAGHQPPVGVHQISPGAGRHIHGHLQ